MEEKERLQLIRCIVRMVRMMDLDHLRGLYLYCAHSRPSR